MSHPRLPAGTIILVTYPNVGTKFGVMISQRDPAKGSLVAFYSLFEHHSRHRQPIDQGKQTRQDLTLQEVKHRIATGGAIHSCCTDFVPSSIMIVQMG